MKTTLKIARTELALLFYSPIAWFLLIAFLFQAVLAFIVVFGLFNIQHADAGMLFAGLLGVYLLLCAYAAIGLFMSCLTSYQVVAALSTLVLLAALSYIGQLWQDID